MVWPSTTIIEPLAWLGKTTWATAVTTSRIGEAGDHRERQQDRHRRPELGFDEASHRGLLGQVNGGDEEVDRLDPEERGDDPADAVDQQVPPQQIGRRRGAVGDAPER